MSEKAGFGLYVHWPFCQAKCPYCDFNSHVSASIDHDRWRRALVSEILRLREITGSRVLDTIFFGGGTPSLMEPETVASVIESATAAWLPSNNMEITLEANPTSVEASRFRGYAAAGVNRVSIGVQSLRDNDLRALGRLHSADDAKRAVHTARDVFPRVSFDLIYGRQHQTLFDWENELGEALSLQPDHISLYQLTIEDGTAFGDRFARGRLQGLPDEDLSADMFEITQDLTNDAGLFSYEISNHARPGEESLHNLIYWRSGDWVGLGPGAHGRVTLPEVRLATEAHKYPGKWLAAVENESDGDCIREAISERDVLEERLIMGLRLSEGVSLKFIPEILFLKINDLINSGYLEIVEKRLRTTRSGRPLLNSVLRLLLA